MQHLKVAEGVKSLPRETLVLWERLEKSTTHPLHRSRASELFLEVLALQDAGTEIDWPSIYCAITTLTRLDKGCLQARLAVGCSELEFRWMLHDRHLYTVHKVPVRFQRCLACMVAKQGPCGDHKATWLCRSRLTDAPPGVDVQNAHCLRPSRQRAYQMTDPHNKKSSSSGAGQQHSELISMYDSHTWPETRRSETFHSQASKLWEFVTEEMKVEDPVELWSIASRACSKRYLLMMAKLWHRASVPEDRIAMDSYVLHAPQDLPDQAAGPVEEALAVQPTQDRQGREGSWMYPTQELLKQLRAELDLDEPSRESSGNSEDCRHKRPWHWLPEMSAHPRWCKMVLPKPLKLKRSGQDSLDSSATPLLSQELSRHGRKRRLTSAMTDMLQGSSSQSPQHNDDPPYERRAPSKGSPQNARGPSKRPHARRAAELLAAQLMAEGIALPDHDAPVKSEDCGQQADSSLIPTTQDDWQARRLSHAGSSNNLSPSISTSLSRFSSSDFTISPGAQLTSPIASGLSINSSTTNQGFAYFGSPSQHITSSARHLGSPSHHVGNSTQQLGMGAYPTTSVDAARGYRGPNPMAGQQWLPQHPSLALHLGQLRSEKQKSRLTPPLDFMGEVWDVDEFPPVPGQLEGSFDVFGLPLDFGVHNNHPMVPKDEPLIFNQSSGWHSHSMPVAGSNPLPGDGFFWSCTVLGNGMNC